MPISSFWSMSIRWVRSPWEMFSAKSFAIKIGLVIDFVIITPSNRDTKTAIPPVTTSKVN